MEGLHEMNYNYDHDRFAGKNKSIARAYEVDKSDSGLERKGFSRFKRAEEASCFNCKTKSKCADFRARTHGGAQGAVSFGGNDALICDRFVPAPPEKKNMSNKQIKSLLKNAKRGLR
jgi:hypothetical protein